MNEFYQILKVKPNASQEEIHTAFRQLAKETHPDLNGNDAKKVARFNQIKEAYDTLSDPGKRTKYDAAQVKIDPVSPMGSSTGFDVALRDQVLALLNRQVHLKWRRLCDFFVGCVLATLMGIVVWTRNTLEMRRILSKVNLSEPREAILLLSILLGIVLVVLCVDTFMIMRTRLMLKKLLTRKG